MTGPVRTISTATHGDESATDGHLFVSIIGPPGAGKSTVVASLAKGDKLPVFRLREAVRSHPDALAPSHDPLGWISLETVRRVLCTAFLEHRFVTGDRPVLLDNFPGTVEQLRLLIEVAAERTWRVAILELQAATPTVVARVAARRVCPGCTTDPHAPAQTAAKNRDRCASCGSVLARRDTDLSRIHTLRLARYRANAPDISELAAQHHVPHLLIDANRPPDEVHRQARHAFARLTDTDTANRSRSRS